jgi:vacuolar-type H+-ATPase subunit F/Vma7
MLNLSQAFKVIFGEGMIGYVIGDSDMITGFRLVGVEGAEAATVEEAKKALQTALTRSDIVVIVLSEVFSKDPMIREQVDKIRQEQVMPLIVELPGSREPSSSLQITETIRKILGIKI